MDRRILTAGIALATGLLVVASSPGWAAPHAQQLRYGITYPTGGMTVSGEVEIRGTAMHPNLDSWQVRYAPGERMGDMNWVDIVVFVTEPIEDDVLCTWDTTTVPDGPYVLALAVWGINDPANPHLYFVENVIVNNAEAEPTPDQPTPEPMPTAVIGPSPTPFSVQLPATSTPRPSPTPRVGENEGAAVSPGGGETGSGLVLDTGGLTGGLRDAFCTGGLITLMLFLLWGLYILAKVSIRWYLRQGTGPAVHRD